MNRSAAHAGASGRKSTVAAKIRHISGARGAPKRKIEGRGSVRGRGEGCAAAGGSTRGERDANKQASISMGKNRGNPTRQVGYKSGT